MVERSELSTPVGLVMRPTRLPCRGAKPPSRSTSTPGFTWAAAVMAVGQTLCVAAMLGVFALLGHLDTIALRGGILGGVLAVLNHFFLAMGVVMATQKAQSEDAKGSKGMVQMSFLFRTAVLFVVMFALLKSGLCNVFSLVLPLLFIRPILIVERFFQKDGEVKS